LFLEFVSYQPRIKKLPTKHSFKTSSFFPYQKKIFKKLDLAKPYFDYSKGVAFQINRFYLSKRKLYG